MPAMFLKPFNSNPTQWLLIVIQPLDQDTVGLQGMLDFFTVIELRGDFCPGSSLTAVPGLILLIWSGNSVAMGKDVASFGLLYGWSPI